MPVIESRRVADVAVLYAAPSVPSKPPVLFVHGYFAEAGVFSEWLGFFADRGWPAYSVQLRGRGGTRPDVDLGNVSMLEFAADAETVARELGGPALIGHSMGGLIGQVLAARRAVRAAVLLSPAPPRGIPIISPRLVLKQLKHLRAIFGSRLVCPAREDLREIVFNDVPAEQQDALIDRLMPDSGRAGREMSITGVPVDAGAVKCPLLFVAARDDRFVPPSIVERTAKRYQAPVRVLEGHAHMLIREPGWREIADWVEQWLAARTG